MVSLLLWSSLLALCVAQYGTWTKHTIPGPGRCLDGTPGAYYLRPPLVPQDFPSSTFVIYHEGGGWCASDENCYERAQGDLGSSKNYPDLPPNRLPDTAGYEGASLFASRYFANATIAYAKYCDGGSWASFNTTPTFVNSTRVWYMGRPLLDGLFADLMANRGLATAKAVMYSGCSAGGLTAYMHIDYLRTLLSPATALLGLADAMFALHVPAFPGPGHETYLEGMMQHCFFAKNSSASVNQACLAHYGYAAGNECFYGGQVAPFVETPMFVVNSKFDTWQEASVVGVSW
jgi:hypothetical protein